MIFLRQELFQAADPTFWTQPAIAVPNMFKYGRSGLSMKPDGAGGRNAYGLVSVNTYARNNLIMIFREVATENVIDSAVGYASALINPVPANGTFIRLCDQANTGRLRIFTREASVTVQNNVTAAATTFTEAADTCNEIFIAMKMLASGATFKYKLGAAPWVTPATQPTGTTVDNLRICIGFPASESFIQYNGFILEQDTGAFADADLDAIIAASILTSTLEPIRSNIPRQKTLNRGQANSLTVRVTSQNIPRTGVTQAQLALTLYRNGVLGAETFGTGFTWTEISNGFYKLDVAEPVLTVDGDYSLWIRPLTAGSNLIDPIEISCDVTPFYGLSMYEHELFTDGHEEVKKPGGGVLVQHNVYDKDGALVVPTPGVPAKVSPFV